MAISLGIYPIFRQTHIKFAFPIFINFPEVMEMASRWTWIWTWPDIALSDSGGDPAKLVNDSGQLQDHQVGCRALANKHGQWNITSCVSPWMIFLLKFRNIWWFSHETTGFLSRLFVSQRTRTLTFDASRTPKPKRSALKWRGEVGAAKPEQLLQTWVVENPPSRALSLQEVRNWISDDFSMSNPDDDISDDWVT